LTRISINMHSEQMDRHAEKTREILERVLNISE